MSKMSSSKKFLEKFDGKKIGGTGSIKISIYTENNPNKYKLKGALSPVKINKVPAHAKRERDGFYVSVRPVSTEKDPVRYYLPATERLNFSFDALSDGGHRPLYFNERILQVFCDRFVTYRRCSMGFRRYFVRGRRVQSFDIRWGWPEKYFPRSTFKERDLLFRQIIDHIYVTKTDGAAQ